MNVHRWLLLVLWSAFLVTGVILNLNHHHSHAWKAEMDAARQTFVRANTAYDEANAALRRAIAAEMQAQELLAHARSCQPL